MIFNSRHFIPTRLERAAGRVSGRFWMSIAIVAAALLGVTASAEEVEPAGPDARAIFDSAAWKDLVKHLRDDALRPTSEERLRAACLPAAVKPPPDDHTTLDMCLEAAIRVADPLATYYTPQQTADHRNAAGKSTFVGIGLELGKKVRDQALVVVSTIAGSAGARAGVAAGDVIVAIDGRDLHGLTMDESIRLLRGPAGTSTTLTIERGVPATTLTLTANRAPIHVMTVRSEADLGVPKIAVLRFAQFRADTDEDLARLLGEVLRPSTEAPESLLLDLRSNPGGSLDAMLRIAGALSTPDAAVVRMIDRAGDKALSTSTAKPASVELSNAAREWLSQVHLAVLVDEGTGSGAEALAQFLHERRHAVLFGARTFGSADVNQIFPLGADASVSVPIAELRSAGGLNWQGTGLKPEYAIPSTLKAEFGSNGDTALRAALAAFRERLRVVTPEDQTVESRR